ncbi:hypothetical protein [Candidatus Palauibacter sp.]|uniref:hypothetical protein n=1 Tax=Candidatus Palauibacter sp. TaxID=3101350 RepID=UPI003B020E55
MSWKRHYLGRPSRRLAPLGALFIGLTVATGCSSVDDGARDESEAARERRQEAADGIAAAVTSAMEGISDAVGEAIEELSEGALVENPVPFRELEAVLPERIDGFRLTSREGGSGGAMGFRLSAVEAEYEGDRDAEIEVEIMDIGALPVIGSETFAEWLSLEVDEESDRGWARTIEYEGYPAMEEFRRTDGDRGRASFSYLVESRFLVDIEGRGISVDELYEIRDRIDTEALADLRDRDGE